MFLLFYTTATRTSGLYSDPPQAGEGRKAPFSRGFESRHSDHVKQLCFSNSFIEKQSCSLSISLTMICFSNSDILMAYQKKYLRWSRLMPPPPCFISFVPHPAAGIADIHTLYHIFLIQFCEKFIFSYHFIFSSKQFNFII